MEKSEIESRIRLSAKNTDLLITRLDTLTGRIDTAMANQNQELVEYYERQFTEASVEFMDSVESILDDWYSLRGEARPSVDAERLSPEDLDAIHNTVVGIVQGLSFLSEAGVPFEAKPTQATAPRAAEGPKNRVDLTG